MKKKKNQPNDSQPSPETPKNSPIDRSRIILPIRCTVGTRHRRRLSQSRSGNADIITTGIILTNTPRRSTAGLPSTISATLLTRPTIGAIGATLGADGRASTRACTAFRATAAGSPGRAAGFAGIGAVPVSAAGATGRTAFHGVVGAFAVAG